MSKKIKHEIGSGNVFEDLGFDKSEEELAKADLVIQINKIIERRRLKQKEAAIILGINQPKVSALKNGRLAGFSIERLLSFLQALDQDVEIVVYPKSTETSHIKIAEGSVQSEVNKKAETEEVVYLYSKDQNKLSWKETYQAMASEVEDWSDLDITVADGLD
jgi:predicted XRE-type DNA-binding protein